MSAAIRPGDFIQTNSHFGDIFFEVTASFPVDGREPYVRFVTYDKYASEPREDWTLGRIRCVISAEMAEPVMRQRSLRFQATHGQFDPCYGYAPRGTPLRTRSPPAYAIPGPLATQSEGRKHGH